MNSVSSSPTTTQCSMAITDNAGQKSKLVTGVTIKVNLEVYYFTVGSNYNSICNDNKEH